jgi:hypothetical protein
MSQDDFSFHVSLTKNIQHTAQCGPKNDQDPRGVEAGTCARQLVSWVEMPWPQLRAMLHGIIGDGYA